MNDVIQCGVLQVEAKQLLRYRVPLLLAILVNGVLIARIPVAAMLGQSPAPSTAMTGQVGPGPGQSDDAGSGDSRTDGNAAANESDANDPQRDSSASSAAVPEMVSSTIQQPGAEDDGDVSSGPLADGADAVQEMPSAPSPPFDPVADETVAFDRVVDETVATGGNGLDAGDLLRTTHGFTRNAGQVMERFLAGLDDLGARVRDWPALEVPDHDSGRPGAASLILCNPAENRGPVRFLLQGRPRELWPGETLESPAAGPWTVEFHRGGDLEDTRRVLDGGAYQFEATRSGWDLQAVDP